MMEITFQWTQDADQSVALPSYETAGAAGADIRANFPPEMRATGLTLMAGARALVPTGLRAEIPQGYEIQVRPRSGWALRDGITLANAPGTVDADYRGQLGVILINLGAEAVQISHGDRIAQLVVAPVARATFTLGQGLTSSERGEGGFGSTGRS
ncbi:MAG: dUTP diphosphatase [Pseudomonadota bacterium]